MENMEKNIAVAKLLGQVVGSLKHGMMKGFESAGLTAPQGMIIGLLGKYEKMKISDISEKMGLSNSTVSGIIDRLEQRDIVIRERSEEDRRVVYVHLSEKAEDVCKGLSMKMNDNLENMMKKASPEDIEKIDEGLNILKKLLDDM
ncbi:MAG: TrmB family transcriptional regulator [Firmicutes bacterium]|nr:TrmB family transcriptional regulator [Bacillota bacterium]